MARDLVKNRQCLSIQVPCFLSGLFPTSACPQAFPTSLFLGSLHTGIPQALRFLQGSGSQNSPLEFSKKSQIKSTNITTSIYPKLELSTPQVFPNTLLLSWIPTSQDCLPGILFFFCDLPQKLTTLFHQAVLSSYKLSFSSLLKWALSVLLRKLDSFPDGSDNWTLSTRNCDKRILVCNLT